MTPRRMLGLDRRASAVAGVTALVVALLTLPAPASASSAKSCPQQVLREWRAGHVGKNHSVACYRAALAGLQEDLRAYSDAPEQIGRALHARLATLTAKQHGHVLGASRRLQRVDPA